MIYVLRCFEDGNIIHVAGKVDPLSDAEVVETELMLADLESLEKRVNGLEKKAKQGDKEAKIAHGLVLQAIELLREGKLARLVKRSDPDEEKAFQGLQLLTAKPVLYVCNVDEASAATGNEYSRKVAEYVVISADIESQLAQLPDDEQKEFLSTLGLEEAGLNKLIREGYKLLGLQTYFTAGPKEARAWTIHKGDKAPQAAGVIHSDFERGFIRAQTIAFDDYINLGGEVPAKEAGKARDEGKEYVVKDGDVMLFRFNT